MIRWTAAQNELLLCIWRKIDRLLLIEFAKAGQLQSLACILRGIHICILYCYICSESTALPCSYEGVSSPYWRESSVV